MLCAHRERTSTALERTTNFLLFYKDAGVYLSVERLLYITSYRICTRPPNGRKGVRELHYDDWILQLRRWMLDGDGI